MPVTRKELEKLKEPIDHKWRIQSTGRKDQNNMAWVTCVAYIDARQVMDKFDEVLGPDNWQDEYYSVNGKEFCKIGINYKASPEESYQEWIWKSDTGCESNPKDYRKALSKMKDLFLPDKYWEWNKEDKEKYQLDNTLFHKGNFKQEFLPLLNNIANDIDQDKRLKGQSSDAFKRAAVHLGPGRNLYDLPMPKIKVKVNGYALNPSVGDVINEKVNLKWPDNLNSFLKIQMPTRVSNPGDPNNSVYIS